MSLSKPCHSFTSHGAPQIRRNSAGGSSQTSGTVSIFYDTLPTMTFADKTVILTGASTGIGRAVAEQLAKDGANLVLAARNAEALEDAAADCRLAGGSALAVPTDITDPAACQRLIAQAASTFGGVDALVCNAGRSMWTRFEEITDLSVFETLMRVNYLGAVYCTHFALPHLKKSKGLIVAVSSLAGKTGVPTRTGYAASKHAIQGFFDSLRIELQDTGVDVLIVAPGFVATNIRKNALGPHGQPLAENPRDETKETMPVEECARRIAGAMRERKREVIMTAKGQAGQWLKLIAPTLVDRIASRTMRERNG